MLGILDDAQIEEVLRSCSVGHIGCRDGDEVYVVPVSYAYAGRSVYGHCADGRKLRSMRTDPHVGFEVEDVHGVAEWMSVVATGLFEELHGEEAATALALLRERFAPYEPGGPIHGHGTSSPPVLFRIRLLAWAGRSEHPSERGRGVPAPHPQAGRRLEHDTLARLMHAVPSPE